MIYVRGEKLFIEAGRIISGQAWRLEKPDRASGRGSRGHVINTDLYVGVRHFEKIQVRQV